MTTQPPFPLDVIRAVQDQIATANSDLHRHLKNNNVAGAQAAMNKGADLNSFGRAGNGKRRTTAVHHAIQKNFPELLSALLAHGADPNERDARRLTPLMAASKSNQAWAIAPLMAKGADPNILETINSKTALSFALEEGADDAVEALLANANTNVHATPSPIRGWSAYLFQAHTARSVRALFEAGVDPNQTFGEPPWAATDWLMTTSRSTSRTSLKMGLEEMGLEEMGLEEMGLEEMGHDDPAGALQALIEGGCKVSNLTFLTAAQKGLSNCLTVLDAAGMDWFAPTECSGDTPFHVLSKENPDLAQHWKEVLDSRSDTKEATRAAKP